jgi:Zn-dependent protease with chaperone function
VIDALHASVTQAAVTVPAASPRALQYARDWELFWLAAQGLGLLLPAVLLFTGLSAGLRNACARIARGGWFGTVALMAAGYVLIAGLVMLPLDYVSDFVHEHAFGESRQSLAGWLSQEAISLAVKLVVAALFVWIPYAVIARSPRRWWLYAAISLVPVAFLVLVALPVFVDPLTTAYRPLTDLRLASEIKALAARCGQGSIPIFIGGDDDTVVGLGPTNRILLDENILKEETPAQIRFTVGHELKHYVLGDNWKALAIIASLLLIGFWLTDRLGRAAIATWSKRFGFTQLSDPASLPLIVLVLTLVWLAVLPSFNLFARHIEHEADRFGLELTHENRAAAELFSGWAKSGVSTPDYDWFRLVFRATHPSPAERIRFANTYHPWSEGKPLRYGDVCSMPR